MVSKILIQGDPVRVFAHMGKVLPQEGVLVTISETAYVGPDEAEEALAWITRVSKEMNYPQMEIAVTIRGESLPQALLDSVEDARR